MAFNTIKFVKGDSYRELWISDDYYRIATSTSPYGGKRHYDDVTAYISDMLANGWHKASTREYYDVKFGVSERLSELRKKREKLLTEISK